MVIALPTRVSSEGGMPQDVPGSTGSRPLVVLHVDDDVINRRVVRDILTAFGHEGVSAASGAEGLELLAERPFDVVLMDIHMPEMGGLEAVDRLRRTPGPNRCVSVIALTADLVTRTLEDYLRLGFDDLIFKPIDVRGFRTAVERAAVFEHQPVVAPMPREA
jgi:CheY-like chemotaxis protein